MSGPIASLDGKVAVITGAGRGLGKAYAAELAGRGVRLIINDLGVSAKGAGADRAPADKVAADLCENFGQRAAIAHHGDVTDPAQMDGLVALAMAEFGALDIAVANAGICDSLPFLDTSIEVFQRYWDIHVGGTINLVKAAWPVMRQRGGGRIILTESGAGLYGLAGQGSYAAAKGAVHGLMRTLALEARPDGIFINAVAPGGFSRMHEAAISDPDMLELTRKAMAPELVAPAIAWLASDACQTMGEVYSVWCGRIARVCIGTELGYFHPTLSMENIVTAFDPAKSTTSLYEPLDSLDEVTAWAEQRIGRNSNAAK